MLKRNGVRYLMCADGSIASEVTNDGVTPRRPDRGQ
jgi:hypothetical protein